MVVFIRYHADGKWPADNTLTIDDVSEEWAEEELRRGPPRVIVRNCPGGEGDYGTPGYKYSPMPATFPCLSSSPYCVHNSSVYCHFRRDDVDAISKCHTHNSTHSLARILQC
jgi:hypothetical protein